MQIVSCGFLRFLSEDWSTAEILVENPGQTGFEPLSFKLKLALADWDTGSQMWEMGHSWLDQQWVLKHCWFDAAATDVPLSKSTFVTIYLAENRPIVQQSQIC